MQKRIPPVCIYTYVYAYLQHVFGVGNVASRRFPSFHPPWRRFALATVAHRTGDLIGRHSSSHSPHKSGSDPPGQNTAGKIPLISHTLCLLIFFAGLLEKISCDVMGKKWALPKWALPIPTLWDRPCFRPAWCNWWLVIFCQHQKASEISPKHIQSFDKKRGSRVETNLH